MPQLKICPRNSACLPLTTWGFCQEGNSTETSGLLLLVFSQIFLSQKIRKCYNPPIDPNMPTLKICPRKAACLPLTSWRFCIEGNSTQSFGLLLLVFSQIFLTQKVRKSVIFEYLFSYSLYDTCFQKNWWHIFGSKFGSQKWVQRSKQITYSSRRPGRRW